MTILVDTTPLVATCDAALTETCFTCRIVANGSGFAPYWTRSACSHPHGERKRILVFELLTKPVGGETDMMHRRHVFARPLTSGVLSSNPCSVTIAALR